MQTLKISICDDDVLGPVVQSIISLTSLLVVKVLIVLVWLIDDWLSWGLTTRQPLWVILCRLPEKGRKETE